MQNSNVRKELWAEEDAKWANLSEKDKSLLLRYRDELLKDHMSSCSVELARYFYSKDFGCEIIPE